MCLNIVTKTFEDNDTEVLAWKVFGYSRNKKVYIPLMRWEDDEYSLGVWAQSRSPKVLSFHKGRFGKSYVAGFHAFAVGGSPASSIPCSVERLVRLKGLLAEGIELWEDKEFKIIVAREMVILEEDS